MGVAVSVAVEGEDEVPVEERADAKFLADLVSSLFTDQSAYQKLGVNSESLTALKRMDESAYADNSEQVQDAWQDPTLLKADLMAVLGGLLRLQGTDREAKRLRKEVARSSSINMEWLLWYQMVLEDAVKVCTWAAQRGKRVALVLW